MEEVKKNENDMKRKKGRIIVIEMKRENEKKKKIASSCHHLSLRRKGKRFGRSKEREGRENRRERGRKNYCFETEEGEQRRPLLAPLPQRFKQEEKMNWRLRGS